jgi:hypothetical protein
MPEEASGQAQPPIETRPFEAPDISQKGYIEVSTVIPPASKEPLTPPPPLTDPQPPADTPNKEGS